MLTLARPPGQVDRLERCEFCASPVRDRTLDVIAAVLGDVDPPRRPAYLSCLWHSPRGVARAHPPAGPIRVCVVACWQVRPL